MKKKSSNGGAGKVFLFLCCVILALIFWASLKYSQANGLPLSLFYLG